MSKIKLTSTIVFVSIIIVIGIIGWALFFLTNITGKIALQWGNPVDPNPAAEIPEFQPFPDAGLSPGEGPGIGECEEAKLIRKFACSIYEEKYPKGCGFFSGRCKGIREVCELAQEEVEEKCSVSSDGE